MVIVADKSKHGVKNFSEEEKAALVELIKNHPELEDRGFSSVSIHRKREAWKKIHSEFLSCFPSQHDQTINQLKGCWKRMKIEAKKASDEKIRSMKKTGGGPPTQELNSTSQMVIEMLGNSIMPLQNENDAPSPLPAENTWVDTEIFGTEDVNAAVMSLGDVTHSLENPVVSSKTEQSRPNKRVRVKKEEELKMQILETVLK